VLDVEPSQIRPAPDFGSRTDLNFIIGMATMSDRLVVLLDVVRLLSDDESVTLDHAA
jgi:purine-binding chemotaxis protein CheW